MSSLLDYTPLEEIPKHVNALKKSFRQQKTSSIEFRLNQLRALYYAIKDNEDVIIKAIQKDLNKSESETQLTELAVTYGDILSLIKELPTLTKPKNAKGTNFLFKPSSPKIEKIPLGTVLIIAPFNFPINLTLQPLIGSIAGGNTTVLKQSEQIPNTSQVLTEILTDALDPSIFRAINGAVPETNVLLEQKFDKIFFTGSPTVGKIIARKAAEQLTPVVLELGGKSPSFVTKSVKGNIDAVAKRILFSKFTNAGQICVATDHILVDASIHDELVIALKKAVDELYPADVKTFGKLVNDNAWERVIGLVKKTNGDIIHGDLSLANKQERFVPPIIVDNVSFNDSLYSEEIFGPVLPIIKYTNLDDTIDQVITNHDTPLALYIYSKDKKEIKYISSQIRSGALSINDSMIHVGLSNIPFGGIGNSGYGNYHGQWSFDAFTHERAQLSNPYWTEILFDAKYPPVSNFDLAKSKFFLIPTPTFGRTGRVRDHNYGLAIITILIGLIGLAVGFFEKRQ
ncbi:putative fatty aldehyde dehydrogenase [Wickerhamomyces ciferrii]|uniref:Aldehyde dehydrogenase n=1 Tax=Wickerhamomyces ciferrii (strain ATCC 14091 / BCRC 22168 / CBS 111 / JCM 3599 / NBRC 0793 / NRRL Y-1031 F-60-10) TaxID=1206466 RepID=K0KDY0_WICCF|nr:putative fatty aldehyde dehydrogenase [Wickerhamomyces ciferrii]CCH41136.1 putative fatty aldehyde dehydrogenase [Wickerhamomyces ciferrii]